MNECRGDESEEEIWDDSLVENKKKEAKKQESENEDSEENTDDEIERIRRNNAVAKLDEKPANASNVNRKEEFDNDVKDEVTGSDVKDMAGSDAKDVANEETDGDDAYDVDTDVDEAPEDEAVSKQKSMPDTTGISFDHVDTYFSGRQFFMYGDFSTKERLVLSRYIVMFGGVVSMYMSADVR